MYNVTRSVPTRHEHHTHRGEQNQGVVFAVMFPLHIEVFHRYANGQACGDEEDELEIRRERIDLDLTAIAG